jgi:nifR3 family TIM-barrel protein
MKIKNIVIDSQVVVGPMAGVSNQAFRKIVKQFNPGLIYSEMVSDKAIVYKNEKTLKMCEVDEEEGLIAMQLFGSDISTMVQAAKYLDQETNCSIIDINMGCPVNKVVSSNGGASLMKDPQLASEIVYAIKQSIKKPLTVKIRTGWDEQHKNAVEFALLLEQAGADAVAVHGRTRSKMYSGVVDLNMIQQVKQALKIPVIGNGDVIDGESAKKMLEITDVDAVMLARAVWGQPWIIKEVVDYLDDKPYNLSLQQRFDVTIAHAKALIDLKGEFTAIREMRSHGSMAVKGYPHSHRVKEKISNASTFEEFEAILSAYQQQLLQEGFQ